MTRKDFGLRAIAIGGLAATLMAAVPAAYAQDKVVVFAAASLKDALDCGNRALVRQRLAEFIADELDVEGQWSGCEVAVRTNA